ncbi:hypothetical protein ACVII0_004916 [Sinorhizobium meliloti]
MKPGTIKRIAAMKISTPAENVQPRIVARPRRLLHAPEHAESLNAQEHDAGDGTCENEKKRHRHADLAPDGDEACDFRKRQPENDERDQETHRPCSQEGECNCPVSGLWVRHRRLNGLSFRTIWNSTRNSNSGSGWKWALLISSHFFS